MPYVSDRCLHERLSVTSALRELAAEYLLGTLPAADYQRQVRALIARYPQDRDSAGHRLEPQTMPERQFA